MTPRVLLTEEAIARRVGELADEIRAALPAPEVTVVGLLTGSFVFVADLTRALSKRGVRQRVHFVETSHYRDGRSPTGEVEVGRPTFSAEAGSSVLLVDDVLDTGLTLERVREVLREQQPAWLRTCVLLDKPARRRARITPDFTGFEIPDCWVVGYGLDDAGALRELPHVAALE